MPPYSTLFEAQANATVEFGNINGPAHYCRDVHAVADPTQYGATCGIYALRNVLRYHWTVAKGNDVQRLRNAPQLAARKHAGRDAQTKQRLSNGNDRVSWVPEKPSIREVAKASGLTLVGELLDGKHIKTLAEKFGYRAEASQHTDTNSYKEKVIELLRNGVPPIVAMDVCSDHGVPVMVSGKSGHWVVAVGYEQRKKMIQNVETTHHIVYLMHWGSYYIAALGALAVSSAQLTRFPGGTYNKRTTEQWVVDETTWLNNNAPTKAVTYAALYGTSRTGLKKKLLGSASTLSLTNVEGGMKGMIVAVYPNQGEAENTFNPYLMHALEQRFVKLAPFGPGEKAALSFLLGTYRVWGLTEHLDVVSYLLGGQLNNTDPAVRALGRIDQSCALAISLKTAIDGWTASAAVT